MRRDVVYTLHFWPKLKHAGHYTGTTPRPVRERNTDHHLRRGARITEVQVERRGSWVIGEVRPGGRAVERQLKNWKNGSKHCDVCKAIKGLESGQLTQEEALAEAGWNRSNEYERGLLLEIFDIEPTPERLSSAQLPEPRPIHPAPPPEVVEEITPEMDALVDSLCEGWLRQQAEAYARAEAEAGPEAAPERALELLRAENCREVPNPLLSAELYPELPAPRPEPDPQVQAEIRPGADVQLEAGPHKAEAAREVLHSDLAREVPAPRPTPDPQVQAEITAGADMQLEAWPHEAEPELEIG